MASVDAKLRWIRAAEMRFGLHGGAVQVQTRRTTVWGRVESREKSNSVAIAIFYSIAAITIAAYGYGIGGVSSLQAGAIYAVVGFVLAFACVGFAPRFVVVVALATGMLGSMMRASIAPEMTSLIPRQTTIDYLQRMMAVCAAIGFGGGLYGGFRFTGKGFFNWISKWVLTRLPASSAPPLPVHSHVMRELARHFHTSERMYFSALAAFGSALVAEVEAKPTPLPRSLLIIALAVFIATNLAWFVGEWLRPRLRVWAESFAFCSRCGRPCSRSCSDTRPSFSFSPVSTPPPGNTIEPRPSKASASSPPCRRALVSLCTSPWSPWPRWR